MLFKIFTLWVFYPTCKHMKGLLNKKRKPRLFQEKEKKRENKTITITFGTDPPVMYLLASS